MGAKQQIDELHANALSVFVNIVKTSGIPSVQAWTETLYEEGHVHYCKNELSVYNVTLTDVRNQSYLSPSSLWIFIVGILDFHILSSR